jgi:hypothetical protein
LLSNIETEGQASVIRQKTQNNPVPPSAGFMKQVRLGHHDEEKEPTKKDVH